MSGNSNNNTYFIYNKIGVNILYSLIGMMSRTKEDYIHVNEAVKVYDKTRQTFYNYINKGLVASKKVHNKLYLKIEDIEKVLGKYLSEDDVLYEYDDENNTYTYTGQPQQEQQTDLSALKEKLQALQTEYEQSYFTIDNKISEVHDNMELKIDTIATSIQDDLNTVTTTFGNRMDSSSQLLFNSIAKHKLITKKFHFLVGYLFIIAINLIIVSYLLTQ